MPDKAGPPPMPGKSPRMPASPTGSSVPPPMPLSDHELSVEPTGNAADKHMAAIPNALLIHLSIAAVMVIVGLIIPRLVLFTVPIFTICGFWVAAKGLQIALSGGASRLMSPLGLYGSQIVLVGLSGLMLIIVAIALLAGVSASEGDAIVRFLLFLLGIVYFPSAIYLRHRAMRHLRNTREQ